MAVWGRQGVDDREIIPWVARQSGIWIHADDSARKDHTALMLAQGISTLWVHRPKYGMSGAKQLRLIAYVLDDFLEKFQLSRRPIHYRASAHGQLNRQRVRLEPYSL